MDGLLWAFELSEPPCFSLWNGVMRINEVGETMRNMYSVYFKTALLVLWRFKNKLEILT